jgi:hypothetical protein
MQTLKKHRDLFRSIAVILLLLLFFGCRKTIHDRRSKTTETPESREYFGCRVNGDDFVSEASSGNVSGSCTYGPSTYSSGSTFHIISNRFGSDCTAGTIEIILDSVNLVEGKSFFLGSPGQKKNFARYSFVSGCAASVSEFVTSDSTFGVVRIKKFRPEIRVITATFFFTVTNKEGVAYQIADGYFDRHFSLE